MEVGGVFRGVVEWWLERGNCEEVRRRQRTKPRLQKKKNSLPSAGGEESRRKRRSETFLPLSRERREQQGTLPPSPSLRAVVVSLSSSQWRITTSSTSSARARSARSGVVFLFLSSSLLFLRRQVHSFCSPPVASKPLSASPCLAGRAQHSCKSFVHRKLSQHSKWPSRPGDKLLFPSLSLSRRCRAIVLLFSQPPPPLFFFPLLPPFSSLSPPALSLRPNSTPPHPGLQGPKKIHGHPRRHQAHRQGRQVPAGPRGTALRGRHPAEAAPPRDRRDARRVRDAERLLRGD